MCEKRPCSICKIPKLESEYYEDQLKCKDCFRKSNRESYERRRLVNGPEAEAERQRARSGVISTRLRNWLSPTAPGDDPGVAA